MNGREGVQWKGEMGPDKALKEGERVPRRLGEERGMVEICQKRARHLIYLPHRILEWSLDGL